MNNLVLSPKFKDFLTTYCEREFLEGTTAAGKTTVGIPKFMLRVAMSDKKDHVLAGTDLGTVEKNIINSALGIANQFKGVAEYNSNGKGKIRLPHIEYHTAKGIKIIYCCGYDNKKRWQKVLGSQMGCVFIDEVNIADMEFMREITHRCDYMMTTSNPDDPSLPIYKEFINKSRPLKKYVNDYPKELLNELNEKRIPGWVHWYFTFWDNASMTEKDIQKKIDAVPEGTKMYKNKIQGLRGKATGLVFGMFGPKNIIPKKQARNYQYKYYTIGIDTAYSSTSDDTISLSFIGITACGKCIILAEEVYNNRDLDNPIAPSDVIKRFVSFAERNRIAWGFAKNSFLDSADQATMTEWKKYKRNNGSIYTIDNAWKKILNITRIQLMQDWIKHGNYLVVDDCTEHIRELGVYSWKEDEYAPEDRNDHTINSGQYGWLPFRKYIVTINEDIKE